MVRQSVLASMLPLVLCCSLAAQSSPPIEPLVPYEPGETELRILPLGTPGSATQLEAAARCDETKARTALVALGWSTTGSTTGSTERVDISELRDGFETYRFFMTRLLPGATDAVGIESLDPGINYYWRVLTATPDGWLSSRVERFEVPVCPFDEIDPGQAPNPGSASQGPTNNSDSR